MSEKQLSVWEYMQSEEEITPIKISKRLKIPRPMISQIMTKLLNLKKIERIDMGRAVRYRMIRL